MLPPINLRNHRSNYEGARGGLPPERLGGSLETPSLRGYKGTSKRPPEITRQIQYMIMQHININIAAPSPAT